MLGKILIYVGILLVILGVILLFVDKLNFLGRLPGDIRIQRDNFRFYFPITTSILISVLISLIIYLIRRLS
ncbi:DUF2905 domain-containing protein [Marinoscillum sp.]|uniref:DUF2905 domain-containing protein n=1 Tax=Marinoscillum sp. TaxID=2024838 RepID=UPI003BA9663C